VVRQLTCHGRAEDAGELADRMVGTDLMDQSGAAPQESRHALLDPQPCDSPALGGSPPIAPASKRLLLVVEHTPAMRARLQDKLTARGFSVVMAMDAGMALAAAEGAEFAYVVLEVQFRGRKALDPIRKLRERDPGMRIIVITDHDSFAMVVLALRAGADDYLAMPINESDLADALLGRKPALPPIPDTPLAPRRIYWEHVQRILAQCDHHVTEAAQRLRMHRRSLQRILSKRAPYPRLPKLVKEPTRRK
jgi:two-component system response regulator RegA